ncbi:MAG: zinc-dependent metalloprotease [bacterium]|nr:zinc-dependent metalloprotease [bacterium]
MTSLMQISKVTAPTSIYDAVVAPDPPFGNDPAEPAGDDPLGGWPLIGDLTRLLRSPAVSRQAAEQLAVAVAADGGGEPQCAPADRIAFSELAGVAQLAAEAATGLPITPDRRAVDVSVVNRSGWAQHTLRDWRPLFGQLAEGLTATREETDPASSPETPEALLRRMMEPLAPLLADMTAGSLTGHLARVALASHDVALPRVRSDRLLLVEPNISAFARAWNLPRDDTCLWVCVHSLVCNAVLGVASVRGRMTDLLAQFAGGFEMNPEKIAESLQEKLADFDAGEAMGEMPALLGHPEMLLGATRSERQEALAEDLADFVAVLGGFVDATTDRACAQLLGSASPVREAFRRRRLSPPGEARRLARFLGVDAGPEASARGARFVQGVTERAGADGLGRLWHAAENWPTPNEVDAPGLWLARLEVYESPEGRGGREGPGDRPDSGR